MEEKKEPYGSDEKIVEIELERLRSFEKHPFKVTEDGQMMELQESIQKYGILNPLIVRPRPEGVYEIISGHRRKFAAEKIGYRKVPVIIRMLNDDEAVISMVDSNLQREMIRPSEKAFAYKMKYEVIKRKAGRRKCGQVDQLFGKKSIEVIGEDCGDSPKQVQRYIRITELIPELLERVDDGSMGFTLAEKLGYKHPYGIAAVSDLLSEKRRTEGNAGGNGVCAVQPIPFPGNPVKKTERRRKTDGADDGDSS